MYPNTTRLRRAIKRKRKEPTNYNELSYLYQTMKYTIEIAFEIRRVWRYQRV